MTKMNSNAPLGVADVPCPAPSAPSVPELAGEGGDAVSEKPGQKKDPKENTKKDEKKPKKPKEKPLVARFNFTCRVFHRPSHCPGVLSL